MINNFINRIFLIFLLCIIPLGLKAQTTSSIYTFNQGEYAQGLVQGSNGDFYFSVNQQIIKLSAAGSVSIVANTYDYPYELAIDGFNNLYFFSYYNSSIQKVYPDGTVETLLSGIDDAYNLKCDSAGNLYFLEYDYDSGRSFKKHTADGQTSFVDTGGYVQSFTVDDAGNIYYTDGYGIKKIGLDGIMTSFYDIDSSNIQNMASDSSGNIYFYDYSNYPAIIRKIDFNGNPQVYLSDDSNLSSPSGLIADANGILYYLNYHSVNNNYELQLIKVALPCARPSTPAANDQSFEDAATVSNLVAIGDNIKWYKTLSGGVSLVDATVLTSRTYYVTQTVNDCESNRIPIIVTINKMGLSIHGQSIANATLKLNLNGAVGTNLFINKYGKSRKNVAVGNGELNYEVFTSPATYAYSAAEFTPFVNPSNLTNAGSSSANVLLNWENAGTLTDANITIPNGGNQFAVQVYGFFIPQESGLYTFTCEGDDAVDLFIDNINVANHYGAHGIEGLGSHTGTIELVSGQSYSFRARMQENGGGEGLRVFWRRPSNSSGWTIYADELSTSNQ